MDKDNQQDEHDFDFSVLWQDIEESGFEKFVPYISLIIAFVTLVIVMTKK